MKRVLKDQTKSDVTLETTCSGAPSRRGYITEACERLGLVCVRRAASGANKAGLVWSPIDQASLRLCACCSHDLMNSKVTQSSQPQRVFKRKRPALNCKCKKKKKQRDTQSHFDPPALHRLHCLHAESSETEKVKKACFSFL